MKPSSSAEKSASPGFDAPWQAQIYAMSQVLIENDVISADVWAEALGASIRRRQSAGGSDTVGEYFQAVSDALVSVLPVEVDELNEMMNAWRAAYEATPHGMPVTLKPAQSDE
ncbi:MAG: hypothetical protein JXQ99_14805 [Hyphomicrobiaceae bacterium]